MKTRQLNITAVIVIAAFLLSAATGYAGQPVWVDNFDSEVLDPTWFWVNENPERWNLSEEPGYMRIYASALPTGGENLLMRPGAEGNFTIETHVFFEPIRNFQLAGLVIYQDEANFIQLGRAYAEPGICPTCYGNGIYFDQLQGGEMVGGNFATQTDLQNEAFLRLELKGNRVTAFYGSDSTDWMEIGEHQLPGGFKVNAVGLTASQDFWMEDDPLPADFEYFSFSGHVKPTSPFVGAWQAVDADGGAMRLAIGGPPNGPFNITWTESYFGLCEGGSGIGKGDGWLDSSDPYLLQGHVSFECFTNDGAAEVDFTWHYDPSTDTITVYGGEGMTNTMWHRPGHPPSPAEWAIVARPFDDAVDGGSFPAGTPEGVVVSLLVLDDDHHPLWYGTTETVIPEWDDRPWAFFGLDWDLTSGDHVWMYDGINAKELIVSALEVTAVDLGSLTVSGTSDAGSDVFVELPGGLSIVTADQDGYWEVIFDDSALGQWWAVYQLDSDDDQTRVPFYVPAARFTFFPEWNSLEGYEWPDGAEVDITVAGKEECSTEATAGYPEWDPWNTFFSLNFPEGCVIIVDDNITLSFGMLDLTHVVQFLSITEVDTETNTVAGMADFDPEQYRLHTWIHEIEDSYMQLTAGGGIWLADFGSLGVDLNVNMGGRVEIVDEHSNATAVDWYIPNPSFTVFPDWNSLEGFGWPDGAEVSISVDGKNECSTEATAGYPEWDPWNTYFWLNFPDDCIVEIGNEITLEYEATTRTHTVQEMAITTVDKEADIVAGTADFGPPYTLHAWIHGVEGSELYPDLIEGTWTVDFGSNGFDLDIDMGGRVEIVDEHSNATAVDWYIPNPHFTVFPEWNSLEGYGWPDGAEVDITVEGKGECSTEAIASYPDWDPWNTFFWLNFPEGCVVGMGDGITLTYGTTERTHTVQYLEITSVDEASDIVAGVADPGAVLYAWIHEVEGSEMELVAEGGFWLADFSSFGLEEGTCGRVENRDDQGNATAVDWCVPTPRLTVFRQWRYVEGWDWPEGATVIATINGTDCQAEGISGHPEWDPQALFVSMNFPEGCDVVAGQTVTFDADGIHREHEVRVLENLVIDELEDTVTGIAEAGATVHVWVHDRYDETYVEVIAAGDDSWTADFTPFDLEEGMCGRAEIHDDQGNATAFDWCVPGDIAIRVTGSDGPEYWVGSGDNIILRWGWGACTLEQIDAFSSALEDTYRLNGVLLEGVWGSPEEAPGLSDFCGGIPGWRIYWEYALGTLPIGQYTVETSVSLSEEITDGIGTYSGTLFESQITIHVG
jgi:hypothetical protein